MSFGVLDNAVCPGLSGGELLVAVFVCIVQSRFLALLCRLHSFESFHDFYGGWLRVLNGDIYQLDADILLRQAVQDHFLDGGLNLVFPCGKHIIHGITSDHGADAALTDIPQDLQRIGGSVQRFYRIAVAGFHVEIHIDEIEIRSDHQGFVLVYGIGVRAVADGQALNGGIHLSDLLDERNFKMETGFRHRLGPAQSNQHGLLLLLDLISGIENQNEQHHRRNDNAGNFSGGRFLPRSIALPFIHGFKPVPPVAKRIISHMETSCLPFRRSICRGTTLIYE